jgi:transcriptional regulator with XRE-family HTH domain
MSAKDQNARIILGLKVKQLRQEQGLSFAELSEASGMSGSYLNEIEKGKKYPKDDKLRALAKALDVTYEELTSTELHESLAPVAELLRSNFLNELPLDLFGIELTKVVEIIANAPTRVGAFISTLLELSQNYALREENFYFGALRSYLELHNNYFEDIENSVEDFMKKNKIPPERPITVDILQRLLEEKYGYTIVGGGLDDYPELQKLRSLFLPKEKKLLLNSRLTPMQRAFQFGKELGFNALGLGARANTSSLLRGRSFEEVLNHSKAIYFSVALHIPRKRIVEDLEAFFSIEKWNGEAFLAIMKRYDATPEMFYHRLTNILPKYFDMRKLFFFRFVHNPEQDTFEMDKELHLDHKHRPRGSGLFEHYCRRWVSLSLLQDLYRMQQEGVFADTMVQAQLSRYHGTADEYLCLTIARPSYPDPDRNVSVTLGLLVNDTLREKVDFLDDPAILRRVVNTTCERCPIADCLERAAGPTVVERRREYQRIQERLRELEGES